MKILMTLRQSQQGEERLKTCTSAFLEEAIEFFLLEDYGDIFLSVLDQLERDTKQKESFERKTKEDNWIFLYNDIYNEWIVCIEKL